MDGTVGFTVRRYSVRVSALKSRALCHFWCRDKTKTRQGQYETKGDRRGSNIGSHTAITRAQGKPCFFSLDRIKSSLQDMTMLGMSPEYRGKEWS